MKLATRGSALALWQANETKSRLGGAAELVIVESSGDRDRTTDLARFGSIGIFTAEVDRAVLDGRADVGVHSMKDMTTTLQDGVVLAGVLPRGLVEDVLVTAGGWTLDTLPVGATVGTGSLRRAAMLRAARPDLNIAQARGNVPTRIAKVMEQHVFDATILARAGIVRLGLEEHISQVISVDRFLPAVGQGIVGLTCRSDDSDTRERLASELRDPSAWAAATAERAFLRKMKGGCNAPVGGHARLTDDGSLRLEGRVLATDGSEVVEGRIEGRAAEAEALALRLADDLSGRGGAALIERAREEGVA